MSTFYVGVAVTVGGALYSADQQRDAGREARDGSIANAAQLYDLTINSNAIRGDVANYNAGMIGEIAYANAAAVERNRDRVAELMTREFEEELRRYQIGEKQLAGTIRAQFSSTGFQTNQGTPLHYLHNELDEAENERNFITERGILTVFNYVSQETERAQLMRLSGDLNSEAVIFNAAAEAEIYLNEAVAQGAAGVSQGSQIQDQFNAQSDASLAGAVATGATAIANNTTKKPDGK